MEQEVKIDPVDQSGAASGATKEDKVSYDSFRKSVEAEKNARKRAQELEAKLQEFERRDMEAKGEFDKLKQSLLAENETLKQTLKKKDETYLWERVTSGLKTEALKEQCVDPDAFISLLKKEDFESLRADSDGYNLNQESVKTLLENKKKSHWYLFNKSEVKINDAAPKGKIDKPKEKAPTEMNNNELAQALNANLGKLFK